MGSAAKIPHLAPTFGNEFRLFGSSLATLLPFNAYFAWKAGLGKFLYCTVVFVWKYFPKDQRINSWRAYYAALPDLASWSHLPALGLWFALHALLPLVYILFFIRYRRASRGSSREAWDRALLVSVVGLVLLLGVAPAPSWFRLCTVSLPAMVVLVFLLSSAGRTERVALRLVLTAAIVLAVAGPLHVQLHWKGLVDLPSGRVAFRRPVFYEMAKWLSVHTQESEYAFDEPLWGFFLHLQNPTPVPWVTDNGYTRPEQVRDVIEGLQRHQVPIVFWAPSSSGRSMNSEA